MDGVKADEPFESLVEAVRACRICRDAPRYGPPLGHEPRPILQLSESARICIASQAPGIRAHTSGRPFDDPSGVRLREWMGIDEAQFYDASRVAILPMGFCFPGVGAGGDLPPRRECREIWQHRLFARLPDLKLLLVIGGHALRWHLGAEWARRGVTETVRAWREIGAAGTSPRIVPLPHPSWHNNRWLKTHGWFEQELLPELRREVHALLA